MIKILSSFGVSLIPLFLGVFLVFSFFAAGETNTIVKQVNHSPENPEPEETLMVKIELQNMHNISSVQIFFCLMDPFVCFYAEDMDYSENDTFASELDLGDNDFKEGTVIGYNFKISYEDGSSEKYPNEGSIQEQYKILEVAPGEYYFTITLQEDASNGSSDDTGIILYFGLGALVVLLIIAGIVKFYYLKKRREKI
ncbi:MAG: hypothetical protein JSW00_12960 [Thermoplasmata archaeon]|nr:MAG: hypothetical protein JSW00_12960 [Thermoplasmata archaeon]